MRALQGPKGLTRSLIKVLTGLDKAPKFISGGLIKSGLDRAFKGSLNDL